MRTLKISPIMLCVCTVIVQLGQAQVCSSPATTIYGLDDVGGIYPITMTTGVVGAKINPAYTGNAPAFSNAMGYDPAGGKFYYFKRNADQGTQEFVSYTPSTATYKILTSCPTTLNIKSGAVAPNGLGYYCIDDGANLYFYRISSDKWKLITNTYYDQWGANVSAILSGRSSGDIAFDGWGDMWYLCSSFSQYGLYQFPATLPTTTVASLSIKQKIAPTTPTPNATSFAGIAISPTGTIYISSFIDNRYYKLNNNLTVSFIGTLNSPAGMDLTACTMPFSVLASNSVELNVENMGAQQIKINWSTENQYLKGFYIECSRDANNWSTLGYLEHSASQLSLAKYSYNYTAPESGRYYFRIRQVGLEGQLVYSDVKFVDLKTNVPISIGPNPTKGTIQLINKDNYTTISVLDVAGHLLKQETLKKGINSISVSELPTGTYILRLRSEYGELYHQKIVKE